MPIEIENARVSDLPWDDVTRLEAEMALHDAAPEVLAEAWAYVNSDNPLERAGLHHEVRDGVLIVNRSAVYEALGNFGSQESPFGDEPSKLRMISRADRLKALEHLRRHVKTIDRVPYMEGE